MQCESKKYPPQKKKTFSNIFTQARCICVKLCQFVASLYPHMLTNFGRFILLPKKIVLTFLGALIVFTVSSFDIHQVKLLDFIANNEWPSIHQTSIHWIIRFGAKLQQKPKSVSEFEI